MIPWLLIGAAEAHRPGLSYARFDGDRLSLVFAEPELAARWPVADLEAASDLVIAGTIGSASLRSEEGDCRIGPAEVRRVEMDGIEIAAAVSCPGGATWTYDAAHLAAFEVGHRQYLEVGGQPVAVLDATRPSGTFDGQGASATEVGLRWAGLGVEHIWTGFDHLAFLLALLLVSTRLRQMLTVVTGFTIAHSITLTLAATDLLTLPPEIVEPAIAASIVLVGLENLWKPPPERRIVVTFLLGLVHGFGFAGMLVELGLPSDALGLALVSFNLGVEAGQAALVIVTLPVLLALRRIPVWTERGVPLVSVLVACAGTYWLIERVSGFLFEPR